MRITERDRRLLADIALQEAMTREQIVRLGYFTSLQRANARLLELRKAGLLRLVHLSPTLETRRHIYAVASGAAPYVDERVASLLRSRSSRPRHIEHSLAVVNVRLELARLGVDRWLAEPQARHRYQVAQGSRRLACDFRPDGLAMVGNAAIFIEADQGQTSLPRFREKLKTYSEYVRHGTFASTYGAKEAYLLVVTTGALRKRHLSAILSAAAPVPATVETHLSLAGRASLAEVFP